ncbi:MAG: hypothetical protein ACOY99_11590 [Pseudomonadota bacterium]
MNPIMRGVLASLCAFALAGGAALAQTPDIQFGGRIGKYLPRIDAVEREREINFRDRLDDKRGLSRSIMRYNQTRFADVAWAGALAVPRAEDYGVKSLLEGLVRLSLARIGRAEDADDIRLTLNWMTVPNHSVAVINFANTYAKGRIARIDPATGKELESHKVMVNFVPRFSVDPNYQGPDFAFLETDEANRVGPVLAYFVSKALAKLYPEADLPEVTMVVVSDGIDRVLTN